MITVKELKKGEFFTRKPIELPTEKQVYIRGDYDRGTRCYECTRFDDISRTVLIPGEKAVYTDFTF